MTSFAAVQRLGDPLVGESLGDDLAGLLLPLCVLSPCRFSAQRKTRTTEFLHTTNGILAGQIRLEVVQKHAHTVVLQQSPVRLEHINAVALHHKPQRVAAAPGIRGRHVKWRDSDKMDGHVACGALRAGAPSAMARLWIRGFCARPV